MAPSPLPNHIQHRLHQHLGLGAGDEGVGGDQEVQGPEFFVAGEVGYGLPLAAADDEGLEAGQFLGGEGLVMTQVQIQAA